MQDLIASEITGTFRAVPFEVATLRIVAALVLAGLIGAEREWRRKPAGLRTHMLVSLGSALFVLVPSQAGMALEDMSRVLQGVASGIGFLGAGAIIKLREESHIKGLTTAAGIWVTSAVGVAAGLGLEATAVLSAVFGWVVLSLLRLTKAK